MRLSDIEYVVLRFVRKYLFSSKILSRIGRFIPFYKVTVGQMSAVPMVKKYLLYCKKKKIQITNKTTLEIGVGVTNSAGYEIVRKGAERAVVFEPYATYNKRIDQQVVDSKSEYRDLVCKVQRITDLADVADKSVDVIFSTSVLEHVSKIEELCEHFARILKKTGCMLHVVDYRDHFFKYPFHFLKFGKRMWRFLNPGLSRMLVVQHVAILEKAGFSVEIVSRESLPEEYQKVKKSIHKDFRKYSDEDLATSFAVLFVRPV